MSSQKVCTDKTRRGVRFEVCLGIKNIYIYISAKKIYIIQVGSGRWSTCPAHFKILYALSVNDWRRSVGSWATLPPLDRMPTPMNFNRTGLKHSIPNQTSLLPNTLPLWSLSLPPHPPHQLRNRSGKGFSSRWSSNMGSKWEY